MQSCMEHVISPVTRTNNGSLFFERGSKAVAVAKTYAVAEDDEDWHSADEGEDVTEAEDPYVIFFIIYIFVLDRRSNCAQL